MNKVVGLTLFFYAFLFNISHSQQLFGIVLDEKTKEPIAGASVYFDNTTVGTITNFEGEFSFDLDNKINSPLVVSFMGYKTISLSTYKYGIKYNIRLEEDVSALEEVFIEYGDEWTRGYKLKQFKEQFLGFSKFSKTCEIINEGDIVLRFNASEKELTAYAKKPLVIKNKALDYVITYDLKTFLVQYDSSDNIRKVVKDNKDHWYWLHSVYYSGTSFFKTEISKQHKKALKNREKAFKGSVLHFMRSISNETLKKERYRIFKGSSQVNPAYYIFTKKKDSLKETVVTIPNELNILYKNKQSVLRSKVKTFMIDAYGNHSPIEQVLFGGFMGNQRVGDALPLDYGLN